MISTRINNIDHLTPSFAVSFNASDPMEKVLQDHTTFPTRAKTTRKAAHPNSPYIKHHGFFASAIATVEDSSRRHLYKQSSEVSRVDSFDMPRYEETRLERKPVLER